MPSLNKRLVAKLRECIHKCYAGYRRKKHISAADSMLNFVNLKSLDQLVFRQTTQE